MSSMFTPPVYTREQIRTLGNQITFPFSDEDAVYDPFLHQYRLTREYFEERGHNLEIELEGSNPKRVENFLRQLQLKIYTKIYSWNKSTRDQMNFLIAKRGLQGGIPPFDMMSYRQSFLDMMFLQGEYLLANGDISMVTGVDLDTMQNMSADVIRNQQRDMHPDAVHMMTQLGLNFRGRYRFPVNGKGKEW